MNEYLGKLLYKRHISLRELCTELSIEFSEDIDVYPYVECDHCMYWHKRSELHKDRGGMLICKVCDEWYGI